MTGNEVITLKAIIGLFVSALLLYIGTWLGIRKERRQFLWSKELDRFFELEQLAGELVEEIGGYQPIPEDRTSIASRMSALDLAAGRFGRYPEVRQAVRDLHNTLGRMFAAKRDHDDDAHSIRAELEPDFRKLLKACDAVVEREKVRAKRPMST